MTANSSPLLIEQFANLRSASFNATPPRRSLHSHHSFHSDLPERLVERCVVVAKQPDGYGLTVRGEHPVFVEGVKEEGAAARAGVREGDQIVKINGMPVSSSNHFEVLRMISAGPTVALTLRGRALSCDECRPLLFDSFNVRRGVDMESDRGSSMCQESDKVEPVRQWVNSGGHYAATASSRADDFDDDEIVLADRLSTAAPIGFGSATALRQNIAELAAFVGFVVRNGDPSATLFYLISDLFQTVAAPLKELRRFAYEIFSTFIVRDAPLQIAGIAQTHIQNIGNVLDAFGNSTATPSADALQKVFIGARSRALAAMEEEFAEFCQQRAAGALEDIGPMGATARLGFAERQLIRLLDELFRAANGDLDRCDERLLATLMSVNTVLRVVIGIKPSNANSEKLSERFPTFVTLPSRSGVFRMKPMISKKSVEKANHPLSLRPVFTQTHCYECRGLVWGVNPQVFGCQYCNVLIHKRCVAQLIDPCYGHPHKSRASTVGAPGGGGRAAARLPKPSSLPLASHQRVASTFAVAAADIVAHRRERSLPAAESLDLPLRMMEDEPPPNAPPPIPESPPPALEFPKRRVDASSDSGIGAEAVAAERPISRSQSAKARAQHLENLSERDSDPNADGHSVRSGSSINSADRQMLERVQGVSDGLEDIDNDVEVPSLDQVVNWQSLRRIDPKVRRFQEGLNELFHTERIHVRHLKVLCRCFFKPIVEQKLATREFVKLVFAGLDELLEIHTEMFEKMRAAQEQWKKDADFDGLYGRLGRAVATFFHDEAGLRFQRAASEHCQHQQHALQLLSDRRSKDEALGNFLARAEANPVCRKFQLKDLLPVEMQRLTKYPLLLDAVLKYVPETSEEYQQFTAATSGAKRLLSVVNTAKKDAENRRHLIEISKKLEMPSSNRPSDVLLRKFDILKYRYVTSGDVVWRHSRGKSDVFLVLLDHILLILTKGADGKYYLRSPDTNAVQLLWLPSVVIEDKPGDKRMFVVFYERDFRSYDLQFQSVAERKNWEQIIKSQISVAKTELPAHAEAADPATVIAQLRSAAASTDDSSGGGMTPNDPGEHVHVTEHPKLVKASEIVVQQPQVMEHAKPVLSLGERFGRSDKLIATALADKHAIIVEQLVASRKIEPNDAKKIDEMLTGVTAADLKRRSGAELAFSAIIHGNRLIDSINTTMNEKRQNMENKIDDSDRILPAVPCYKLTTIAAPLISHLTALSQVIKEQRDEIEALRSRLDPSGGSTHGLQMATINSPAASRIVLVSPTPSNPT